MSDLKTLLTEDGSSTLYSDNYKSSYHSTHGALQESAHIFIKHGLDYYNNSYNPKIINVLEYGMGTGLNVILALEFAINNKIKISYQTLELHPVENSILEKLNYSKLFEDKFSIFIKKIFDSRWDQTIQINEYFELTKRHIDFKYFNPNTKFDVIFYDCFGPGSQPALWEEPFLSKVKGFMSSKAILTTFCAKGTFKRALKSLNLKVEGLPGPPGKREITRTIND